jgi:predicted aspartyl protease
VKDGSLKLIDSRSRMEIRFMVGKKRKQLRMNSSKHISTLIIGLVLLTATAAVPGTYFIGRDGGGVYFQTEQHGGWYIDREDLKFFQPGQKGHYSTGRDAAGTYIVTDGDHRFYLDIDARQAQERKNRAYNQQQAGSTDSRKETPVVIAGNQVLVPVTLGYGQKKIEARLLLDTGASITTIHREIAKKLTISKTQKARLMVPGGSTVTVDVAKLSYVKVGPKKQANLYAGIIDHIGPTVSHQGLLGMDFLRNVEYRIDFERNVIEWQ